MNFTKTTMWAECEKLRELHNITCADLSKNVFPEVSTSYYATRRNLKDGGIRTPFMTLQYLGLKQVVFRKTLPTSQVIEAVVDITQKDTIEIIEQLVYAVSILAFNTPLTRLPQTLRRAIVQDKVTSVLTLTTFEKAFEAIGNVTMAFHYTPLASMEDMF